jgi:capsular polysaccharide biosynthesis protein
MLVNLADEHFKEEGSFTEEEEEEDHSEIKNLMVHEIKALISEAMTEVEEEVMKDIQIGAIIMQTYSVIIVKSMSIMRKIVHNTNLKTRMLTLLERN